MTLYQIRKFACSLPETIEQPHFKFTSFRVRGKILATAPPSGEYLHLFVDDEARDQALVLYPEYVEKLYWGKKNVGLKIVLRAASPAVIKKLVLCAWTNKAPKTLRSNASGKI